MIRDHHIDVIPLGRREPPRAVEIFRMAHSIARVDQDLAQGLADKRSGINAEQVKGLGVGSGHKQDEFPLENCVGPAPKTSRIAIPGATETRPCSRGIGGEERTARSAEQFPRCRDSAA